MFIAHTDPSQHPTYNEFWFYKVADQVLVYYSEHIDVEHDRVLETGEAKVFAR